MFLSLFFNYVIVDSFLTLRDNSRILTKVSIIAKVVCTASLLFKIVANIYKPFSLKALGVYLVCCPRLLSSKVEIFDFIDFHSLLFNSKKYPLGNLSGLFFTASLILYKQFV